MKSPMIHSPRDEAESLSRVTLTHSQGIDSASPMPTSLGSGGERGTRDGGNKNRASAFGDGSNEYWGNIDRNIAGYSP